MSHRPYTPSLSPSPPRLHSILVLFLVLCAPLLCCSLSISSASSATGDLSDRCDDPRNCPPDQSTGGQPPPPPPDMTSTLRCPALELDPILTYNQSMHCTIECKQGAAATPGKVSDYQWLAEELSNVNGVAAAQPVTGDLLEDTTVAGPHASDVKFGSVSNFSTYDNSQLIDFVYTAANVGSQGVLHVQAGPEGAEILGSPITFALKPPSDSGNSTTPPVVPPHQSSSSFVSLSNPAFIAACGAAALLLMVALVGGVWARRVFARKAEELRERQASERQWAHSVPSLQARIDATQPSTLRAPLLR